MPRRGSGNGSSAARACISTSSIIPANGCSICRCFGSTIGTGRATALEQSRTPARKTASKPWRAALAEIDPAAAADEAVAETLADLFKDYLREARADLYALSTLPPGRFLMPGDLAGSPALTFAPLDAKDGESFARGSLWSMMERRYEAYKSYVVRPFFREHFARLDRQIVLIDVLTALNGGQPAVADLERAMTEILECFRTGANSLWSSLFAPRIDRIVLAATKADHLHHQSHDRLEAILAKLAGRAMARAEYAGAEVKVLAMAAIRATREGEAKRNGEKLPCIVGYPLPGEIIGAADLRRQRAVRHLPGRPARGCGSRAERVADRAWRDALRALQAAKSRCRSLPEASPPSQISASTAPSRR